MADVFISYAREDRPMAIRLAEAIESHGWTVWWDRRIPAGRSYEDVIEHEIDQASCVIVLWTSKSVVSEWVRNEAGEGARRKILIPIRLEDVRLPLSFRHLQADDLLEWTSAEINDCLASIESMIGAPPKREPEPPQVTARAMAEILAPAPAPIDLTGVLANNDTPSNDPSIPPPQFTPAATEMSNPELPPADTPAAKPNATRLAVFDPFPGSPANSATPADPQVILPIPDNLRVPPSSLRKMWIIIAVILALFLIGLLAPRSKNETDPGTAGTTNVDTSTTGSLDTSVTGTTGTLDSATTMLSPDPVSVVETNTSFTRSTFTTTSVVAMADVIDFQTAEGTFTIELFPNAAPEHVRNFLKVAQSGGFDGAAVNYIDKPGIWAGYGSSIDMPQEPNELAYTRGTLMGVMRPNGADAGTEFFIAVSDASGSDRQKNTAFGRVIAGMGVVDAIAKVPVDDKYRPKKPITITRAVVRARG